MNNNSNLLTIAVLMIPVLSLIAPLKLMRCRLSSRHLSSANFFATPDIEIIEKLKSYSEASFRLKQIKEWVYDRGVMDFNCMSNLPNDLRLKLRDEYHFGSLLQVKEQVSKDGTIKRAYKLHDGQIIESVLMPYNDSRQTACISSQAGCAMGCVFCATGQMGFSRQLSSSEIFEQVQSFSAELRQRGKRLSNVVFMGMGEPMANYEQVSIAIGRICNDLGIGARHITVSTVGMVPRIKKLADDCSKVSLAVSLHQSNDEDRSKIMPVNNRYPIAELLDACKYYIEKTNRRVSFEWALVRGRTDTPDKAHELGRLLSGMLCHVNVIPLNPTAGYDEKPSTKQEVAKFIEILGEYGIPATIRVRRGIDISAGCGQLKAELLQTRCKMPARADTSTV